MSGMWVTCTCGQCGDKHSRVETPAQRHEARMSTPRVIIAGLTIEASANPMMGGWHIGSWGALQILGALDVAGFRVVEKEPPPSAQRVLAAEAPLNARNGESLGLS